MKMLVPCQPNDYDITFIVATIIGEWKLCFCLFECGFELPGSSGLSRQFIIPTASTKLKGGYTGFTLSFCLSVHLWTELCLFKFNQMHNHLFVFVSALQSFHCKLW